MGEFMFQKTGTTLSRVRGLGVLSLARFGRLAIVLGTLGGLALMVNGMEARG
jgi:hypothetical protein